MTLFATQKNRQWHNSFELGLSSGVVAPAESSSAPTDFSTESIILDGVDEHLTANLGALPAPYTLSTWVKFGSLNQGVGDYDYVMSLGEGVNSQISMSRFNGGGGDADKFYYYDGFTARLGPVLTGQVWAHIAIAATTGSPYVILWINGVSQTVAATTQAMNTNGVLSVGRFNPGGHFLNGNEDSLSIWDKTLSTAEVGEIYAAGKPEDLNDHSAFANLIHWYLFGEDALDDATGGSGTIRDQIGGAHLTPQNTEAGDIVEDAP